MTPDFLYIGTGKAGSTWLFQALERHPQIHVSPVKETTFFDLNFHRGLAWYERFFERAGPQQRIGEIAHRYLRNPNCAQRILDTLGPEVRLIVFYRRPEQFVMSNYLFARRNGRFAGSLRDWVERRFDPRSVSYHTMLQPYLQRFDRERILVACFDDLQSDPQGFYARLCRFLQVSEQKLPDDLQAKINAAARPRMSWLARWVNRTSKMLKRNGQPSPVALVKRMPIVQRLLYSTLADRDKPDMPADLAARIRSVAEPEARALDAALGTELWQRWYGASSAAIPSAPIHCHAA